MSKAPDAFRTISEVADWLETPAHVLRFWESKFSQVKPVKRAGGRRYYRLNDMMLLGGIKRLLHQDGLTIKEVQKLLREKGVKHVAGQSPYTIEGDDADTIESSAADVEEAIEVKIEEPVPEPVFHSVSAQKEDKQQESNVVPLNRDDDQMLFPGFEFISERRDKPESTQESPEEIKTEDIQPSPPTEPEEPAAPAPNPIDISHINADPDLGSIPARGGILTFLSALPSGSLANKLEDVQKFVTAMSEVSVLKTPVGKS